MKHLTLIFLSVLICFSGYATHFVGGEIRIKHLQSYDYKIEMSFFRDQTGIQGPQQQTILVYERSNPGNVVDSIVVYLDSVSQVPNKTTGCGSPILGIDEFHLSNILTLNPANYSHPGGYYFTCWAYARNNFIANIGPNSLGAMMVTLFPPITDGSGNQITNSSPVLTSPISDFAVNNHPYYLDFGGFDSDGDSLDYVLYTPFIDMPPSAGTQSALSFPYPDPIYQFSPIQWGSGFSLQNVIPGLGGTQNSLQINNQTGELTMIPNAPAPAYYVYGIWCREYRDGQLIGSVFRDFQISLLDYQINPNAAPQVHVPQLQSLATWDADTMVFTGSPVCVQLGVTDPDSIADIEIEAVYSDYDPGDLTFVQSSAIIFNPDTFQTALCFQPDSFLPYTTRGDVVALNPGCYDLRGDTLPFYFKFVGYSNAGWGGTQTIAMSNVSGNVDLFSMLNHNPNAGGQWIEITNSGRLQANGMFNTSTLPVPSTYEFYYIDEQPNYPADTAYLKVNFVQTTALEIGEVQEINIYPNPANDILTISGISETAVFEIFDFHGRKIKSEQLTPGNNTINTTGLKEGLYFYQYQNQRGKFLIQR